MWEDAFLSVPIDRFFAAAKALKAGSAEAVRASSCNLVCMPSVTTVEMVAGKTAHTLHSAPGAPTAFRAPFRSLFSLGAVRAVRGTGKMANALSVTDPDKLKTFIYQAIRSLESGDQKQLAAVVAEGRKFEASLDQASVRKSTSAALGVLKAAGAPLSEAEAAWVTNFVGL